MEEPSVAPTMVCVPEMDSENEVARRFHTADPPAGGKEVDTLNSKS